MPFLAIARSRLVLSSLSRGIDPTRSTTVGSMNMRPCTAIRPLTNPLGPLEALVLAQVGSVLENLCEALCGVHYGLVGTFMSAGAQASQGGGGSHLGVERVGHVHACIHALGTRVDRHRVTVSDASYRKVGRIEVERG